MITPKKDKICTLRFRCKNINKDYCDVYANKCNYVDLKDD